LPELSRFFGIIIRMYYDDHPPPHFHALYGETEAQIGIDPIIVLQGDLPRRAMSMVIEWSALHQHELLENWERLRDSLPAQKIEPLEQERDMFPRITNVTYVDGYLLELTFEDGVRARLDFAERVVGRGGVFAPLEDVSFFKQVRVDPVAGTVVWPNDVDLDPDVLYSEATSTPIEIAEKS